jgi:hypothetical protein
LALVAAGDSLAAAVSAAALEGGGIVITVIVGTVGTAVWLASGPWDWWKNGGADAASTWWSNTRAAVGSFRCRDAARSPTSTPVG